MYDDDGDGIVPTDNINQGKFLFVLLGFCRGGNIFLFAGKAQDVHHSLFGKTLSPVGVVFGKMSFRSATEGIARMEGG